MINIGIGTPATRTETNEKLIWTKYIVVKKYSFAYREIEPVQYDKGHVDS